jgi:hypothetical protein
MRKALIPILLALALLAAPTAGADATLYRGGGDGIQVEFRVRGHKIVYARIAAGLYCTRSGGERHRNRVRSYFGVHDFPKDATDISTRPITVRRNGRFSDEAPRGEEDSGFSEKILEGVVRSDVVSGRFRIRDHFEIECRTGGYQRYGSRHFAKDTLHFRARRR